jgi:abortive infection alpha-like protein
MMTDDKNLIPISDEQAKLGQEAPKTLHGLGCFLKETFGTMPQDIVGLLGGDYLKVRRAENLFRTVERAKKRFEDRGIKHPDASPSLAIPIMIAAADESRDELQEMWAALLAAAANPKKSREFRLKFIEIVKRLDPIDPLDLERLTPSGPPYADLRDLAEMARSLGVQSDEVAVSLGNLGALGLAHRLSSRDEHPNYPLMDSTALGRELLRIVDKDNTKS